MKKILTLIFVFQVYLAIGQTFNVTTNDITLDIKKLIGPATIIKLTHAVKYQNDFYCFFEEVKEDNSRREIKFCFVFSDNGENLKKIEVPDAIQNTNYYDLFVKNNRVFAITYMDKKTFYFDIEKSKWIKTKDADDLIFEDEKFFVYSLDFGEWGGKTWFKDKKTGSEYAIEARTPLINKIDTSYYLSSSYNVLKIDNPLDLNKCNNDITYENIEKGAKYASWYGKPLGFEIVFHATTSRSYFDNSYNPRIVSSFVLKNELFHIYETDTVTYIAKAKGNSIEPIQKVGNELRFYDPEYSYRMKIQLDGQQLLKFKIEHNFGLMVINGQDIYRYNLILK